MQLLYLVPEFPSQTHAFFWREVQALRSRGMDVVLVSTRRPAADACRHVFAAEAIRQTHYLFPPRWIRDVVFLCCRPVRLVTALSYLAGLRESTWRQRLAAVPLILPAASLTRLSIDQGADHLHVHSFANAAHVAAIARILGGCSYSLTLHGDLDVYGRDHVSKTRGARFVTCVTAPLKRQIVGKLGVPENKVHLLWMGVDTDRFRPPTGRRLRSPNEPLRLLSVARLHVNKGHRFALRALKPLVESGLRLRYIIVGDGPARADIEQEVQALGLADFVTLVGTKSESEVLDLLQENDVLLLTSVGLGEAAPVAVMEAMSCGLSVVSSVIGGVRDMIDHGVDGLLVEQEDVEGIARSLRSLSEDPAEAIRMGQAARDRAVRDFDSRSLAGEMIRLITAKAT